MPIEFRCQQCAKLLRVSDETAGKQAKCPSCGAVQTIPAAAPSPEMRSPPPAGNPFGAAPPMPPTTSGAEQNPYQAPPSYPGEFAGAAYGAETLGVFQTTMIDAGDILSRTWAIFKIHWGMCTLAFFIVWIIGFAAGLVLGPLAVLCTAAMGLKQNDPETAIVNQLLVQIIAFPLETWLSAGLTLFMLKTASGQAPSITDVFAGGRYFLPMLLARILFVLAYLIGVAACIVPGVLLGLMFSQYSFIIIDRGAGGIESLSLSKEITTGNKGAIFLLYLATIPIGLLGCAAAIVGVFFAQGFLLLMFAVAYLAMSGQRTTDQMFPTPASR